MRHTYITVTSTHVTCTSTHMYVHIHKRTHTHASRMHTWIYAQSSTHKEPLFFFHNFKFHANTIVVVCTFMRGKHYVTQPTRARMQAPRHSTAPRCISFSLLFPSSASTYSHQDYMSTYLL